MLKLKLQYFSLQTQRANSLEKTLMLGKTEGRRRRRRRQQRIGWMAPLTQWIWTWANSRRQWGTGRPGMLQSMGSQKGRHDLVTEQQLSPLPSPFFKHSSFLILATTVFLLHIHCLQCQYPLHHCQTELSQLKTYCHSQLKILPTWGQSTKHDNDLPMQNNYPPCPLILQQYSNI